MGCESENSSNGVDDCFFCADGIHWDTHRIGWAVSGACAAATVLITLFTLTMHARNYQVPAAQRQVMRVLLMPPVYAVVSFFSYRYYTEYEYYVLAETAYEAITLSAFLMLLMHLVAYGTAERDIHAALIEKDKRKLPFPLNCWRFRASKPYFWHTLSFSVMQYVIIRPLISIVGVVCQYYNVLCPSTYSVKYAAVYLDAVDFVSISVALYGLIVFYVLCKDELKGRRPLSKFLAIKLIVFFTFYQGFLFSILQSHGVIKATSLWTAANVSHGLSALCTTIEMVFFSIYMGWAYTWRDYTNPQINTHQRQTNSQTYFQAIWDTINLADFAREIWLAGRFFIAFLRGKPGTHGSEKTQMQLAFMPDTMDDGMQLPMTQQTLHPGASGKTGFVDSQGGNPDGSHAAPTGYPNGGDSYTGAGNVPVPPQSAATGAWAQHAQQSQVYHRNAQQSPANYQQSQANAFPAAYPTGNYSSYPSNPAGFHGDLDTSSVQSHSTANTAYYSADGYTPYTEEQQHPNASPVYHTQHPYQQTSQTGIPGNPRLY